MKLKFCTSEIYKHIFLVKVGHPTTFRSPFMSVVTVGSVIIKDVLKILHQPIMAVCVYGLYEPWTVNVCYVLTCTSGERLSFAI